MKFKYIMKTLVLAYLMMLGGIVQAMPLVPGTAITATGILAFQGDFNGDGKFDFVERSGNQVTVNMADGNGSFTAVPTQTFTAITAIGSVVACDINGDGNLDLIMQHSNNGMVYEALGAGDGTFVLNPTPLFTLALLPAQEVLEAAVDMNGDGSIDFLTSQEDAVTNPTATSLKVWLATGGTYTASPAYLTGGLMSLGAAFSGLSVADINNDSYLDVVVLLPTAGQVAVLLGSNAGALATPVTYTLTNTNLKGVTVADIDGAIGRDILISGRSNTVATPDSLSVLMNTGNGTFGAEIQYPMSSQGLTSLFLRTADFNMDGKLDVVASQDGGKIAVLPGNGTGGFGAPVEYAESLSSVFNLFVGDINSDQKPDVVIRGVASGTAFSLFTVPLINMNTTGLIQGSITINSNASTTSNSIVSLNLTCITNTGALCASGTTMAFSNDNSAWTQPVSWTTTAPWGLTSGVGVKTVYVRFTDTANNAATVNDTIELISPPSGGGCLSPVQSSMQLLLLMFTALFGFASWMKRKDT